MAREIIIDTDPGRDDAVAILLALAVPGVLSVLGVTCVAGNVALDATWRNARRVCALAGRADIPVLAGCDRPLIRAPATAAHVHGADGLAGLDLPRRPDQICHGTEIAAWLAHHLPATPMQVIMAHPDQGPEIILGAYENEIATTAVLRTVRAVEAPGVHGAMLHWAESGADAPLFGAPALAGDSLQFFPTSFASTSLNGASDDTAGLLSLRVDAAAGQQLASITLSDLEPGVTLPDSLFRYRPPEGVEVFAG